MSGSKALRLPSETNDGETDSAEIKDFISAGKTEGQNRTTFLTFDSGKVGKGHLFMF